MARRRTLAEDLAELEATNPEVAEAAAAYDRELWRIALRRRIAARRAAEGQDAAGG